MPRKKTKDNEDSSGLNEKDAWDQAIFRDEDGDEEIEEDEFEYLDKEDDEFPAENAETASSGSSENNNNDKEESTLNNQEAESEIDEEALNDLDDTVNSEMMNFDQYLARGSAYRGLVLNIPKELRNWNAQWERFKKYKETMDNPSVSKRLKDDAKNNYCLELLPLIKKIANRDFPTFLNSNTAEDFLQQGFIGVSGGMKSYDPSIGPPIQFFEKHIRHFLQSYVQEFILHSTRSDEQNATKIARAKCKLMRDGMREEDITPEIISKETGIAVSMIEELINTKGLSTMSIDDTEHPLMAPAGIESDPVKALENKMLKEMIDKELETLSEIEREVMLYKVYDRLSPTDISKKLEIPITEVNSIYERARAKLEANGKLRAAYGKRISERNYISEVSIIPLEINKRNPLAKFFTQDEIDDDEDDE